MHVHSATSQDYESTFNSRGHSYDRAMRAVPQARRNEFEALIELASFKDGDVVCDFPSGGGYSQRYIKHIVQLTLLETSRVFYELCLENRAGDVVLTTENTIPFSDAYFDKILSLAGLHHNFSQRQFFVECARCLRPGGRLCIADVHEESKVGLFLNEFVNEHSEEGHNGQFLGEHSVAEIRSAGLGVDHARLCSYPWVFQSIEEMIQFCSLLFGIERASPATVLDGIKSYLGFETTDQAVLMNWELYFIAATKP